MPKEDRGLLSAYKKNDDPDPTTYKFEKAALQFRVNSGTFGQPTAERKFDAAKYSSMHNNLISKGIYWRWVILESEGRNSVNANSCD